MDGPAVSGSCPNLSKVSDLKVEKTSDAEYLFSLVDTSENPIKKFILKQFNEEMFKDKIRKSLLSLCSDVPSKADSATIEAMMAEMQKQDLYTRMLEASLEVKDDDVLAGVLRIFKKISVMANVSTSPERDTIVPFTVHDIEIQFQDGFIENIIVTGKMDGIPDLLKFENFFPIAFSTRRDFRVLYITNIFERTIFSGDEKLGGIKGPIRMSLGDLFFYKQNLDIDSKDYSPFNQVYRSSITDTVTVVNLYKEKTSKILELLIFSDLKGIEGDNPNGLIQFELSKKLNFLNHRRGWSGASGNILNFGFLNFATPFFSMNKIEKNNRRLIPGFMGTRQKDTLLPNNFASTLDLYQFQAFTLGANVNFMTIDVPGLKSTLTINGSFSYGRTPIQDTLRIKTDSSNFSPIEANNVITYGVNNFQLAPEICWQLFPQKRYGITFSQKFMHFWTETTKLKQVKDSVHYVDYIKSLNGDRSRINDYEYSKWLASFQIFAFFRPSEFNQVFFRYRFNWDLNNVRMNFHQLQLGISTYLTHTKKDKDQQND